MPDITKDLLPGLEKHRIPELDLGDGLIHPQYQGQSILNIPDTICKLLDIPSLGGVPLIPEILTPLGDDAQKVVLVLMDALSLRQLQQWMEDEPGLVWNRLAGEGILAPITSIVPSTTSTAITTLWTGASPAQHGILGYELWLKEYGVTANMIEHKPITYQGGVGSLKQAGFSPDTFLPVQTITPHFEKHGVSINAFQHYSIIGSGLSEMIMKEANRQPISTPADLWVSLRQKLEATAGERSISWVYWGAVDGLSHFNGPFNERVKAEFSSFSFAFEQNFLNKLTPQARKNTLVILTADHGQITTNNQDTHYNLVNHPDFTRRLHMLPTGENRLAYLYIRPGQTEAVQEYIQRAWPNQFAILEPEYAVEKGLFGPGTPYERVYERLGDLIVAARGDAYWWWANKKNPLIGRHGGLSPDEMLVPFLAVRL